MKHPPHRVVSLTVADRTAAARALLALVQTPVPIKTPKAS